MQSSCLRPWTCTVSRAMEDVIGNQINSLPPGAGQSFRGNDMSVHTKHMTLPNNINVCVSPVTQSYPTLHDPMDCSPPGSSVRGISQARILEWFAISSSRESSQFRDGTHISSIGRWILYQCHLGSLPFSLEKLIK